MKIAVGSMNEAKLAGVEVAAQQSFDEAVTVGKEQADSQVSPMPTSEGEALTGAFNRAEQAVNAGEYDLGVGVESYVQERRVGLFLSGWCIVMDGDDRFGYGGRGRIELPKQVAERVRDGEELGPVISDIYGGDDEDETGMNQGAISVLTDGAVTRQDAVEQAARYAFAPFANKTVFGETAKEAVETI